MFKKFLLLFILLFVFGFTFLSHVTNAFAVLTYTATSIDPTNDAQGPFNDTATKTIKVEFHNVPNDNDLQICLANDEQGSRGSSAPRCEDNISFFGTGITVDRRIIKATNNSGTVGPIYVCGDGEPALKLAPKGTSTCGPNDYFHANHTYHVRLYHGSVEHKNLYPPTNENPTYSETGETGKGGDIPLYINPGKVNIDVSAVDKDGKLKIVNGPDKITLNDYIGITLKGRRPGGDTNNNYGIFITQVSDNTHVNRPERVCGTVPAGGNESIRATFEPLPEGSYVAHIVEQTQEAKPARSINPIGIFTDSTCTYGNRIAEVPFTVGTDANPGSAGTPIKAYSADPPEPDAPGPHCLSFEKTADGDICHYESAIGEINTSVPGFIKTVLTLLLSLGGGIALLIIILSGYSMMTSQGNPERLQEARGRITSAIVGLLMIIFSLVIVQIIGLDILHLPFFSSNNVHSVPGAGSGAPIIQPQP